MGDTFRDKHLDLPRLLNGCARCSPSAGLRLSGCTGYCSSGWTGVYADLRSSLHRVESMYSLAMTQTVWFVASASDLEGQMCVEPSRWRISGHKQRLFLRKSSRHGLCLMLSPLLLSCCQAGWSSINLSRHTHRRYSWSSSWCYAVITALAECEQPRCPLLTVVREGLLDRDRTSGWHGPQF